jgi:hypothetical protein
MAFKLKTSEDSGIVPLSADAEYSQQFAILSVILRGIDDGTQQLDLIRLESYFAGKSSKGLSTRDSIANKKMVRLRAEFQQPGSAADATGVTVPPAVDAALRLLRGESTALKGDSGKLHASIVERLEILQNAACEQGAIVQEIKSRKSTEVAARLQAEHRNLLLVTYRALQEFCHAAQAEQSFRIGILQAGYSIMPHILPAPATASATFVGAETMPDSQISTFRRQLEVLGVLR